MATYSTDLTTLTNAESGTWYELTGTILGFTLSGAGSPAADEENFIQGTDCRSQTTGKAVDAEISIVFDYGSGYTFSAGYVVFGWCFYAVGVNLKTKANSGWMFVICNSLTTGDYFVIGGSDYGRNPYGGWMNVAIDPTATESGTLGSGGNGGTYRYFGHVCNTIGEISKGTPSAVDAIRAGRGIISVTGSGGTFSELASYNDYNGGSTPPGTSSTSVDSGRHRLGLFQAASGTYLWKGLLSLGTSGTSATFTDSNETIIIDDCPYTYPSFNKIEVNNASSSVTLNNITFISTATTANGVGYFEMVADATLAMTGCSFNNMGTFIFDSNSTVTGCSFNSCGQITTGAADLVGCKINSSTNSPAVLCASPGEAALITGSTFTSAGTGHAIEIGGTAANITLADNIFTGYDTADPGTSTNKAIYVNIASGSMTITVSGGSGLGQTSVRSAGATVTVNSDVTVTFTGMKDNSEVRVYKTSDDSVVAGIEDATAGTTNNRSFAWSAPAATNVYYVIHNFQDGVPMYQTIRKNGYIVPATDTEVGIQQIIDRNVV